MNRRKTLHKPVSGEASKTLNDFEKRHLNELSKKLTHTGKPELSCDDLMKFENLCNQSEAHMDHAFDLLMVLLEKKHSEIRYGVVLVCDHMFKKYEKFRERMVSHLKHFIDHTTETNSKHPLPPPKRAANALQNNAVKVIADWHRNYCNIYLTLQRAYLFLRGSLKVDFRAIEQQRRLAERKEAEKKLRLEGKMKEKLKSVLEEMNEVLHEATMTVASLNTCITLLLPPPENFFLPAAEESSMNEGDECSSNASESSEMDLREHGIVGASQNVVFTLSSDAPQISTNKDNYPLVENAKDFYRQIIKQYQPKVKRWIKILTDAKDVDGQLEEANQLKNEMDRVLRQYNDLGLQEITVRTQSDDSEESEMEEVVTKEGYEETVRDVMLEELIKAKDKRKAEQLNSPIVATKSVKPSSSMKYNERKSQPSLPKDIEEWTDEKLVTPVITCPKPDLHQVWSSASASQLDDVPTPVVSSRAVEFSSSFEPVKWACRNILPSGKLCPRMDRVKCPLHGPIVPRDEQGRCSRPEDALKEVMRKEKHERENPDWQDPQLLAEIQSSTGVDLKMPVKGKRKKKPAEFPGLTDLKALAKHETPRSRLAKKLFKGVRKNKRPATLIEKSKKKEFR